MNRINTYYFILFTILVASCAPKPPSKTTEDTYSEDLSDYRPNYDMGVAALINSEAQTEEENFPSPTSDITNQLNNMLDKAARKNQAENYVEGYTILIPTSSRQEATQIRQKVNELDHSLKPQMDYEPPSWRVKVGRYYTRLEAQKTLSLLKERIPKALLVPDKIPIR